MFVFSTTVIDQQKTVEHFDEIIKTKENIIKELNEKIKQLNHVHECKEEHFKILLNIKYEDKIKAVDSLTKQIEYLIKKRKVALKCLNSIEAQ